MALVRFAIIFVFLARIVSAQQASMPLKTEQDYAKAMRELHALDTSLRNNIEEVARADLERVLLFETTMKARDEAARMEEILANILTFWEAKKTRDAITLSRDALAEAANISKALAVIDLHSPSVATLAQERLNKICASCHAAHREKLPDGTFRIK
jgi:hypothetical protein